VEASEEKDDGQEYFIDVLLKVGILVSVSVSVVDDSRSFMLLFRLRKILPLASHLHKFGLKWIHLCLKVTTPQHQVSVGCCSTWDDSLRFDDTVCWWYVVQPRCCCCCCCNRFKSVSKMNWIVSWAMQLHQRKNTWIPLTTSNVL